MRMPKSKLFVSPRKIPKVFRPSKEHKRTSKDLQHLQNMSEKARNLWKKNEEIIAYECDVNVNKVNTDDRKISSGKLDLLSPQRDTNELAEEVLSELLDNMKKIVALTETDPSLLKVSFEIIEVQRKHDDFISRLDSHVNVTSVLQRPLQWEMKCFEELAKIPSSRINPITEINEENSALYLQQVLDTVENDLSALKKFVEEYQNNDDYVFRNMVDAYRIHLYKMVEAILVTEVEEKQLNSILLFLGDFRQKFPRSQYSDLWQDRDGKYELNIISQEKNEDITNRYLERQSVIIQEQLTRCLGIEIKHWLSGDQSPQQTTQWPVDVVDLCYQNLHVSNQIGSYVYQKIHQLLKTKVTNAVKLYGAAAKYYIEPCKLPGSSRCPEIDRLRQERNGSQNVSVIFHQQIVHAILNNFSLLDTHLSTLSGKFRTEDSDEHFKGLQAFVREQAIECLNHYKKHIFNPALKRCSKTLLTPEWLQGSTTTDDFCDVVRTYITALKSNYFTEWFDDVRLRVHHVYLKAMCRSCKELKCGNAEHRQEIADRIKLDKRRIERMVSQISPGYHEEYIGLLQQITDVIESTDKQSCQTSVTILKHQQRAIINKTHLKAVITIHGGFGSRNRRLIGSLYRSTSFR